MFLEYLKFGLTHILDPDGIDHVLFLVVLVISYSLLEWKQVLILATAFTIGHSVTLALAAKDLVRINSNQIEILIAVSIAITALYNLQTIKSATGNISRYASALLFGLIHGLGFSNYFRIIVGQDALLQPLLGFNIGVEIAQVLTVMVVLLFGYLITDLLKVPKKYYVWIVSILVFIKAIMMVLERI